MRARDIATAFGKWVVGKFWKRENSVESARTMRTRVRHPSLRAERFVKYGVSNADIFSAVLVLTTDRGVRACERSQLRFAQPPDSSLCWGEPSRGNHRAPQATLLLHFYVGEIGTLLLVFSAEV